MAVTITTTYAGKKAGAMFVSAVGIDSTSIGRGGFTINQAVKGKTAIRLIKADANIWATEDGTFTPTGDLALTSKNVSLDYKKVNLTLKKNEIAVDWAAFDMADGATGTLAGETRTKLEEEIKGRVAIGTDASIWADLVAEMVADASVVDVTLTALTVANIISNMQKVVEAFGMTDSAGANDAAIYVSEKTKAILNGAQIGKGVLDMRGDKTQDYGGVQIITSASIPNDKIVMTRVSNMHFLCDSYSDFNTFGMIDQSPITGANAINVVMNAGFKASYVDGTQVVYGTV